MQAAAAFKEQMDDVKAEVIWGFPKIRATCLGVPIIRTIVFWGLYWGLLILGNYHITFDPKILRL